MLTILFTFLLGSNDTTGIASYYSDRFIGKKTTSGQVFSQSKLTAACNVYKLGTKVQVTNLENNKSIIVVINDRIGDKRRIIDLSKLGARKLDFLGKGLTKVKLNVIL